MVNYAVALTIFMSLVKNGFIFQTAVSGIQPSLPSSVEKWSLVNLLVPPLYFLILFNYCGIPT